MAFESAPLTSISVQITARCNLSCTHCAVDSSASSTSSWSELMVAELFNQMGERTPILDLTGGEPLLEWNIVKSFGTYATRKQMFWGLTTNGILLSDERIEQLISMNIYGIKVSLDGLSKAHEAVRGPGTFIKAWSAIERLVRKGVRVAVQTAVSRHNQSDIQQMIHMLDELGVNTLILFPLMPLGRQAGLSGPILSGESLKRFILDIKKISTFHIGIHLELPHCAALFAERSIDERAQCGAGYMLHYTAQGHAYPCPVFPLTLGTLASNHIDDILSRHPVMDALRARDGIDPRCCNCSSFMQCGGGCRAMAYISSGDLYAPDPYCWLIK